MVSNTECPVNNSIIKVAMSVITRKPSSRILLCKISKLFDVNHKTDVHQLGASKMSHEAIIKVKSLWYTLQ